MVIVATDMALRLAGKVSPTMAMQVGGIIPPPTPASSRNPTAMAKLGASAVPTEPATTITAPSMSTGFRPYASENGPDTRAVTAQATAEAVTSWAVTGKEVFRPRDMSTSSGPNMVTAVMVQKTVNAIASRRTE